MIYFSAGHYQQAQGAARNGTTEWLVTNELLKKLYHKHAARTPNGSIGQKVEYLMRTMKSADIAIDLHLDSATDKTRNGAMIYFNNNDKASFDLATIILRTYCAASGQKFNNVLSENVSNYKSLGFISNGSKLHSRRFVLELGFISNKDDLDSVNENAIKGLLAITEKFAPKTEKEILIEKINKLRNSDNSIAKKFLPLLVLKLKLILKR